MPTAIWAPEFRDEQADNNYPFADGCTLTTIDGLPLDPAMILDATLTTIGGQAGAYLARIEVVNRLVTFWFGDPAEPLRASGQFDPIKPPAFIALVDSYKRPAGLLVTGPQALAGAQAWPLGSHDFRPEAAELVAACVVPTPEACLRGLLTVKGELITGDVWLVGESGVVLRWDELVHAIRVDVVGDPLFERRLCWPITRFRTPSFLRAINVIMPNGAHQRIDPVNGNINITAGTSRPPDTILRIAPAGPDRIRLGVVGRSTQG